MDKEYGTHKAGQIKEAYNRRPGSGNCLNVTNRKDRMGRGMKIGCTNKRYGEALREKGRKEIGKLII